MKFFLDTANPDDIRKAAEWGIVDGDGIEAGSALSKEGIRVNVTLLFSPPVQESIAAKAGAYFQPEPVGAAR